MYFSLLKTREFLKIVHFQIQLLHKIANMMQKMTLKATYAEDNQVSFKLT